MIPDLLWSALIKYALCIDPSSQNVISLPNSFFNLLRFHVYGIDLHRINDLKSCLNKSGD